MKLAAAVVGGNDCGTLMPKIQILTRVENCLLKMEIAEEYYKKRVLELLSTLAGLNALHRRLTWVRVFLFALFSFSIWMVFKEGSWMWGSVVAFLLILFLYSVKRHARVSQSRVLHQKILWVVRGELAGLNQDYSYWEDGEEYLDSNHSFSLDFDLFGSRSLFQMMNRTGTKGGSNCLAAALQNPCLDGGRITQRQQAIEELEDRPEFREKLHALTLLICEEGFDSSKLIQWGETDIKKPLMDRVKVAFFMVPLLQLLNTYLFVNSYIGESLFAMILLAPLIAAAFRLKKTQEEIRPLEDIWEQLVLLSQSFATLEHVNFEAVILRDIKIATSESSQAISELKSISEAIDNRSNFLLSILGNMFFIWEYWCVWRLQKWKLRHGSQLKSWIGDLSNLEMYASFATFNYNHRGRSCTPVIEDSASFHFHDLRHPLLSGSKIVGNNLVLSKDEIAIITGANMSGKSTFLRTVGVSLVLAMNGCNVLAESFSFRPIQLFSSMRTSDSLQNNESYFFNELQRLHELVQRLEAGEEVLTILDEILKGTNSKDKAEGSFKFVEKLIKFGAPGLIATHDLSLCVLDEKHATHVVNVFFDVEVLDDDLKFDYTLRKGVCSNMNATFLMRKMGIIDG